MEDSHDRLEREVDRQTSELVAANERLKTEVARRAEAETALREEHRHLSNVLAIYEKDRQLVAYDIHDGFVQTATGASMGMQAALAAYPTDPDRAQENVASALRLLQQSLAQVRSLVHGLRPAELEEAGLVAAIGQLVRDTENNSQVGVEWSPKVAFERLSPVLEMSIFRIVQEALTNAVRHSKSSRVSIVMRQSNGTIQLRIEDWGIGFDIAAAKVGHYGLEGIRERARLFGGEARIDSAPGEGTRIEVELPVIQRELRT
jgi:signal transduction histidine kinase